MNAFSVAPHTPTHIAAWLEQVIAHITADKHIPESHVVLCTSLPEILDAHTRYVLLTSEYADHAHTNVVHIPVPQRLNDIANFITMQANAAPQVIALAHTWVLQRKFRTLVHADQDSIRLTQMECELLSYLAARLDANISREELMQHVWQYDSQTQSHTLETHLYRLRGKLDALTPQPCAILTTDAGYSLRL